MVELVVGFFVCATAVAILWWHDTREPTEWGDLISPEVRVAYEALRDKFRVEERVIDGTTGRATRAGARADALRLLGASTDLLVGLVPDRVELVRRLSLYARLVAAVAPPPVRLRTRLGVVRRGFGALARSLRSRDRSTDDRWERIVRARDTFKALDEETLESCRALVMAVADMESRNAA